MPLFTLWRTLDHTLSESEREAITLRAIGACEWFPGVRWQRSYVIDEPGRLLSLCVYEGPSLEAVREQSVRCAVPFMEIRPVAEVALADIAGPQPTGRDPMFLVDRIFAPGTHAATIERAVQASVDGVQWLRSYIDAARATTRCIVAAPTLAAVRSHAHYVGLPCGAIEAVQENHPSLWGDVYDSFSLARHWETRPVEETP
jgi:hypothetical protein